MAFISQSNQCYLSSTRFSLFVLAISTSSTYCINAELLVNSMSCKSVTRIFQNKADDPANP